MLTPPRSTKKVLSSTLQRESIFHKTLHRMRKTELRQREEKTNRWIIPENLQRRKQSFSNGKQNSLMKMGKPYINTIHRALISYFTFDVPFQNHARANHWIVSPPVVFPKIRQQDRIGLLRLIKECSVTSSTFGRGSLSRLITFFMHLFNCTDHFRDHLFPIGYPN